MSTHGDPDPDSSTPEAEPGTDSTVTDWHGQDVERDVDAAEEALERADGDEDEAEQIFGDIRPDHQGDKFDVPAAERDGTIDEPDGD